MLFILEFSKVKLQLIFADHGIGCTAMGLWEYLNLYRAHVYIFLYQCLRT